MFQKIIRNDEIDAKTKTKIYSTLMPHTKGDVSPCWTIMELQIPLILWKAF